MSSLPPHLVNAIRRNRLIPFVGAGVSRDVRARNNSKPLFPTWKELLEHSADRTGQNGNAVGQTEILGHIAQSRYYQAAHTAKQSLGNDWVNFLRMMIDKRHLDAVEGSLTLARAVWSLGSNLIITTNYDRVLRWSCPDPQDLRELAIEDAAANLDILAQEHSRLTVWHIHGHIDRPAEIILTAGDSESLYGDQAKYELAYFTLLNVLIANTILFIGFSLDDDNLVSVLSRANLMGQRLSGPHFALIHKDRADQVQERIHDLGVIVIPYDDYGPPLLSRIESIAKHRVNRHLADSAILDITDELTQIWPGAYYRSPRSPARAFPAPFRRGDTLGSGAAQYTSTRLLALGKLGALWSADQGTTRVTALVAFNRVASSSELRGEFELSIERFSALDHPGFPKIVARPCLESGRLFCVLEPVPIVSYDQWSRDKLQTETDIVKVSLAIFRALDYLHNRGYCHGNIRPRSIFVDPSTLAVKILGIDSISRSGISGMAREGSSAFFAPSFAETGVNTVSADLFSLVMLTVFSLEQGVLPGVLDDAAEFVSNRVRCSPRLKDLIDRLLKICEGTAANGSDFGEQILRFVQASSDALLPEAVEDKGALIGPEDSKGPIVPIGQDNASMANSIAKREFIASSVMIVALIVAMFLVSYVVECTTGGTLWSNREGRAQHDASSWPKTVSVPRLPPSADLGINFCRCPGDAIDVPVRTASASECWNQRTLSKAREDARCSLNPAGAGCEKGVDPVEKECDERRLSLYEFEQRHLKHPIKAIKVQPALPSQTAPPSQTALPSQTAPLSQEVEWGP